MRWANVVVPVELRGAVLAEEPLAARPAHRRRVELGSSAAHSSGPRRLQVVGQHQAGGPVEVHLERSEPGERLA